MNLRRHLERLSLGRAGGQAVPAPVVESTAESTMLSREQTLAELRERMGVLLAQKPAARPTEQQAKLLDEVDFGALGFELETGTSTPVWRLRRVLGESSCVGDMPVTGVAGSDSEILALLALDPSLSGRALGGALFLDTETTGLGGAGTFAFLLGMLYTEDGATIFEQVLLAGPEQELGLLEICKQRVEAATLLVSFNGKAFDWPLLAGRFVMNGLPAPRPAAHLDLLHVARRIHGQRLARCNLKHLESHVLGYVREEDLEGALVAERYLEYLRSQEAALLAQVVEHNRWDVLTMGALVNLYGQALPRLPADDLVAMARTLLRSRAHDRARVLLGHAVQAGAGAAAWRVRADLHRAHGEHEQRAVELERVHEQGDDPKLRLELAKLYEHKLRLHRRALELLRLGLAESAEQSARREQRLLRKLEKVS